MVFGTYFFATLLVAGCLACPNPPKGLGHEDVADPAPNVMAYVDYGHSNNRGDPCIANVSTNAGVRVAAGMLDIWTPSTLLVDAGVSTTSTASCPGFPASTWTGIPRDATDGTIKNADIFQLNIEYCIAKTSARTADGELAAYLDDRRNKGYSVLDGFGPLKTAWIAGSQQTTTITKIPSPLPTKAESDGGNNLGVGNSSGNFNMGLAVDFVNLMSNDAASTEPAKRFYKCARAWRWNSSIIVAPSLETAKSSTPGTDSGYISGHAAEAWRDVIGMAYLVPQRAQALFARAALLGDNRILAGMHSPLDVLGGRLQGMAVATYNLNKFGLGSVAAAARAQTLSYLYSQTGATNEAELYKIAHSTDAERLANKAIFDNAMNYGFPAIYDTGLPASVPKGAEAIIETRFPYLSAAQRRVVLKSTAFDSGYPIINDTEGWGRLNLFAAVDGYGRFDGDVSVTMDAKKGGYNAEDRWLNDIEGAGKLVKDGSGALHLGGTNSYTGGTHLKAGTLYADSTWALGLGDVYAQAGVLAVSSDKPLAVGGKLTMLKDSKLEFAVTSTHNHYIESASLVTIEGAELHVSFPGTYKPKAGDIINVVAGKLVVGLWNRIKVDGFSFFLPVFTGTGFRIVLL